MLAKQTNKKHCTFENLPVRLYHAAETSERITS